MTSLSRALRACLLAFIPIVTFAAAPEVGPFFEPNQPFFDSQVQVSPEDQITGRDVNFVVRGVIVPATPTLIVAFDQELLRVAGIWNADANSDPITPETMAQTSYARPKR
ncbi:MAG: hypothetical protein ABIV50_00320, partial [Opitutus sp.]